MDSFGLIVFVHKSQVSILVFVELDLGLLPSKDLCSFEPMVSILVFVELDLGL